MTNSPTSVPVVQPQPSTAFYTIANLDLFTTYDRTGYQKAFGIQAPTYDPSRPPKDWFDTSVAGQSGTVSYHYIDIATPNKAGLATVTMPAADAASINLPGAVTYPAVTVAPSDAYVVQEPGGSQQPINPAYLATLDQANLIANLWQLPSSAIQIQTLSGPFAIVYPADEPRRQYAIQLKDGSSALVAAAIAEMYANGIGAPGNWDLSQNQPKWIATPQTAPTPTLPMRPLPIRPLLPNEAIATNIFGSAMIYRTDMTSVYNQQPQTAPGSGLTPEQLSMLTRIDANIQTILRSAGLPVAS